MKRTPLKRKTPLRKKKAQGIDSLKSKVWDIFSKYIRMRDCLRTKGNLDWGNCITCGTMINRKDGDAGHFIQGRRNSILFSEKCVHLQCRRCNRFLGGEPLKYRRAIIKLYGEGIDIELEDLGMETKKFSIPELEELKAYYTERIREFEKGNYEIVWREE